MSKTHLAQTMAHQPIRNRIEITQTWQHCQSVNGWTVVAMLCVLLLGACSTPDIRAPGASGNPDELLIVDCLLPGQVRQLGRQVSFISPRRPTKTSAATCEIRGGEYVSFDRADAGTSLKIWLPQAEEGDPLAQTYVGEIFEKGLGVEPDYLVAARWYRQASEQGYSRAQINLGYLYESGLGVEQDLPQAMNLYRRASGINEGELEYVSTVEFAKRELAKRDTAILESRVGELAQQLTASENRYKALQGQTRSEKSELVSLRKEIEVKRQEVVAANSIDSTVDSQTAQVLVEIETVNGLLNIESLKNKELQSEQRANRKALRELRSGIIADSQEIKQLKLRLAEQVALIDTLEEALGAHGGGAASDLDRVALAKAKSGAVQIKKVVYDIRQQGSSASGSEIQALGDAEERELTLENALRQRTDTLRDLRRQQADLQASYQKSIANLQSELDLSVAEQTRVAGRLADTELSVVSIAAENKQLRSRLREQNQAVASREKEQQRLTARISSLALSERASQAEKNAAEASSRAANAELALARYEQSRLITRLVEAELGANRDKQDAANQLAILEKKLAIQSGIVDTREFQLSSLEESVSKGRAQSEVKAAEAVAQVVALGPTIEIIEPAVLITRGPGEIVSQSDGTVEVVGRVDPVENLLTFLINGDRQAVNDSGVFRFRSTQAIDQLELTAVDNAGERSRISFTVSKRVGNKVTIPQSARGQADGNAYPDVEFGDYHAIVIGNNQYNDMSNLQTAEKDARVVDQVLRQQYGFNTHLLINASKYEILQAFDTARTTLTEQDNLIVYYAGHGQLDPDGAQGYWLPVDAEADDSSQWIANAVVTNYLDSIPARQIMVVADSCFSGTLTKTSIPRMQMDMPPELRARWLTLMAKRKVRTVLSSGGVKPVYEGSDTHSLFASAFIDELSRNKGVLEGHRLYSDLRETVQRSATRLGVDQTPQYAAVKHAGHEVGEFMFVAR